jgi:membrane protease YdiL (CAAX protease family)
MGSAPISTAFLLASLAAVVLLETAGGIPGAYLQLPHWWQFAAIRLMQTLALLAIAIVIKDGLNAIGLDKRRILHGFKLGLIWSAGFAAVAAVLFLILIGAGLNPLVMIRAPLPMETSQRVLYFFVGGIVGPVFEEILFRGLIFGYLRRWGIAVANLISTRYLPDAHGMLRWWGIASAILVSTGLFAALHLPTIPVTQIVGGLVFATAYHISGSLVTPIVIHTLGNLAIFALSLFAA